MTTKHLLNKKDISDIQSWMGKISQGLNTTSTSGSYGNLGVREVGLWKEEHTTLLSSVKWSSLIKNEDKWHYKDWAAYIGKYVCIYGYLDVHAIAIIENKKAMNLKKNREVFGRPQGGEQKGEMISSIIILLLLNHKSILTCWHFLIGYNWPCMSLFCL